MRYPDGGGLDARERARRERVRLTRPGTTGRARLIYRTHLDCGSGKYRRKSFAETEYARLLDGAHQELGGAIVLVWDNLPAHTSRKMRQLIAARSWLTVFQLPSWRRIGSRTPGTCS